MRPRGCLYAQVPQPEAAARSERLCRRQTLSGLILLGFGLCFNSTGCSERQNSAELTIYAAVSTRDALQAIIANYSRLSGTKVHCNFGSSGDLARQILAANQADLFFSADEEEMQRLSAAQMLLEETRRPLLSNRLVVVEAIDPRHPQATLFSLPFQAEQLAQPAVERIALANVETVPAGKYAKAWLEQCGLWERVQERVVPAVDVRAALAMVESASVQAGIVYQTEAMRSSKVRRLLVVQGTCEPRIAYSVALLKDRPAILEAHKFLSHLRTAESRALFEQHGFVSYRAERE